MNGNCKTYIIMNELTKKGKRAKILFLLPMFLFGMGVFVLFSCSSNNDSPDEPIPEDMAYTMQLNGTEIDELKCLENGEFVNIDLSEADSYFGNRIAWVAPQLLHFDEGVLKIIREAGMEESYPIKWEGDALLMKLDEGSTFQKVGFVKEDNVLCLNMGFYIRKAELKSHRTLWMMGQEYGLTDCRTMAENSHSMIWARVNYSYHKIKK